MESQPRRLKAKSRKKKPTVAIVNEVVEGMAIAVVSELVVCSWELLEALESDGIEVSTEFSVFGKNRSSPRDESVDQRLLAHLLLLLVLFFGIEIVRDFKDRKERPKERSGIGLYALLLALLAFVGETVCAF